LEGARRSASLGRWICAAVFVVTVAVYARSLGNAAVWDDRPLVLDNPYLRSFAGIANLFSADLWSASGQGEPSSFYRPLTMLTFWLNAHVGGHSAASFRLGNILIHATNAVLIAVLLGRMKAAGWAVAGILAAAWAVAPICSEPVMWISGRFDLLVVTFAILALLGTRLHGPRGIALTLVAVACGILSKESFIVWLPVLLLDDLLVRRADTDEKAQAGPRLRDALVLYGGIAALIACYFVARRMLELPSATVALYTGLPTLIQSFFFLVATFVRVLVWPMSLDPFRPYAPLSLLSLAFTLLVSALTVGATLAWLYFRRESVRPRIAAEGLAWFGMATLPSALVGPNLDMIGDRYAYLPLVGLVMSAAAVVCALRARFATPAAWRLPALAMAVLGTCEAWVTVRRAPDWHDDDTLAASSLANSPGNPYALYWIGSMAAQRGDLATADDLLAQSLHNNPDSWRTWNAICYLRLHQNRLDEAEQACREGLVRHPENPRGWVNLASVYVQRARWRDAAFAAERAVLLKSRYGEARYLAAAAAANLGNLDRARLHLAKGIEVDPGNVRLRDLERQLPIR
jgi:tetratricopeptide (TPR) repeat protein